MIKSEKGISLPTLVITVIMMLIINGAIVYKSLESIELRKLDNMYNDIKVLNQKVSKYYLENNKLPILEALISEIPNIPNKNINDSDNYYIIDLEKLGGVTLKYGKQYKDYLTDNQNNDVYIINEDSHTIYYLKGIEINDTTFYGANETFSEIIIPVTQ